MKKHLLLAALASVFVMSCAVSSKPLMNLEYVSATENKVDTQNAKEYGTVQSECVSQGEGDFGLMETAVTKALAKAPGATFLKEAKFSTRGACVEVTGTAMGPQ
jgi:hypothetical protein